MRKNLLITLLFFISTSAFSLSLDITNHPHKDYLIGYKRSYPGDCDVVWWASRWNTEHIISVGQCAGIGEDRVIFDMNSLMEHLKNTTNHKNFSEYNKAIELNDHKAASKSPYGLSPSTGYPVQFCLDGDRGRYFFSSRNTSFRPGWKSIYLIRDSKGNEKMEQVGYWQVTMEGTVIATSDVASTVIYEHGTKPCGYVQPN
ncbi:MULTISPECIES: hypothetical protein [Alcaligenes]|uniref:hypothetical protein n=1 Tax=Alcaligenes TaxID=507 RepID=UPI0013DDEE98|nr:hypothetical protein [Alcaligenes faecalis]